MTLCVREIAIRTARAWRTCTRSSRLSDTSVYILTAPRHATTMSRLPSARGGALVRPSPPPCIRSTWSGFHSDLPSAARTTDLDDSGSCPRRSRMAGRVQELCDGVVLRGVGHAGGGEQAGLAAQERAGIWRALVVGVEPVRHRRPTRARRR
jgi:hypothetical protein